MNTKLFSIKSNADTRFCLLLGSGFLGNHFFNELQNRALQGSIELTLCGQTNLAWSDLENVESGLTALLKQTHNGCLDIIWALGKNGFSANELEMQQEYLLLRYILQSIVRVPHQWRSFHFMSSAGALYEGQVAVSSVHQYAPINAYGVWKLKQEALLDEFNLTSRIYRISSAYGVIEKGHRVGLIAALLHSVKYETVFTCTGDRNTLRDYIYCNDIASYVIQKMLYTHDNSVEILASGMAYSIRNIIDTVAELTQRKLNIVYQDAPGNFRDITFSEAVIPKGLPTTPLVKGIVDMAESINLSTDKFGPLWNQVSLSENTMAHL